MYMAAYFYFHNLNATSLSDIIWNFIFLEFTRRKKMDKSNKNLRTLQYTYTSEATKFNVSSSYRLWNLRVHTDAHIDINTTSGPVGSNRTSSAFYAQCFNFLIHGLKTIRNYSKTENLTRNTTNVNHLKFYLAFSPKRFGRSIIYLPVLVLNYLV